MRASSRPNRRARNASCLTEIGYALGKLQNDPGAICGRGASRLPFVKHPWIGPIGYAWTASTTGLVAHDVAPFGVIYVAMAIRERLVVLVHEPVMSHPQDVADLVRDRHGDRRAGVMHNEERLVRGRTDAC